MDASQEREPFHGLLLRNRGRTGLMQREVAARAGVSIRSVQDWESGTTLPSAGPLRALIRVLLDAGGLTHGREASEARELWTAAEREGRRKHVPFDEQWFASLFGAIAPPTSASVRDDALQPAGDAERGAGGAEPTFRAAPRGARAQDWGEAPDTAAFVGRSEELAVLDGWVAEGCRVVAVLGMGGIGKTILAASLAQMVVPSFDR